MDFQIFLAGLNDDGLFTVNVVSLEQAIFDRHRRRLRIDRDRCRHDYGGAALGWEPNLAVAHFVSGGLARTVALNVQHAVLFAVGDRAYLRSFAGREIIELLATDSINAAVAAHPKITSAIVENREDTIVIKAFVDGVTGEPAILESSQAAVIGPDPERAVCIFV